MKRPLRILPLSFLLLALTWLASCSCNDREERLAKIRGHNGSEALGPVAEVVEETEGARLYREKTCVVCHGQNGIHPLQPNYPVLARQGRDYVLRQLKDIQSGNRANGSTSLMRPVIQGMTEEEFTILADFIANELGGDLPVGTGKVDPESPGAILFKTKTCLACHGKDGKSPILPDYPRLAGLTKEYALQQMQDIKSGARANSPAVLGMKGIMHLLSDEQLPELAEYISTLPR